MSDDYVHPVKLVFRAFDTGIEKANQVAESARSAPVVEAGQISEYALLLQRSLERSAQAARHVYRTNAGLYDGHLFTSSLLEDKANLDRLKTCKNDLRDAIDEVDDDDISTLDPTAFTKLREQGKKCSEDCIFVFQRAAEAVRQIAISVAQGTRDDRTLLLSSLPQRAPSLRKPVPLPSTSSIAQSPSTSTTMQVIPEAPASVELRSPWSIETPSQLFDLGPTARPAPATSSRRHSVRDLSPRSQPVLIPGEAVQYRINSNDEFLKRRSQSRISFQKELRQSVASIEKKPSETVGDRPQAPILGDSNSSSWMPASLASPIDSNAKRVGINGYGDMMIRQRSQGHSSQGTSARDSRTSSILIDPRTDARARRKDSQESIFGLRAQAPASLPLSDHQDRCCNSIANEWGILSPAAPLATTLHVPGYGQGVPDGLHPIPGLDDVYDDGKIIVDPIPETQTLPPATAKPAEYPMRHDSSFYKRGGFCDGSRAMIRGKEGFKVVKRPSGYYSATVSAKCIECSYEVGWNDIEKDRLLDRSGIHGNNGIRWRQKFISKCHLKSNAMEEPTYACIFCIETKRTIEEHDATVFFSYIELFRHLATHPRPLPAVSGIAILYGVQPAEIVDFDIHFITPAPVPAQYSMAEIFQKVATRPGGFAVNTHHPKNNHPNARDPDGNPVLHFAAGARILGITFPEPWGGKWCIGYHDGLRGSFPATEFQLDKPSNSDIMMDPQSTLVTIAKWDFVPIDRKDGNWLMFKRGEKIECIGYSFVDHWCWSGRNEKKKWGLFPSCFVEGAQDGTVSNTRLGTSTGSMSVKSSFGFGGRVGTFGLRRKESSANPPRIEGMRRSSSSLRSVNSSGSTGSPGVLVKGQPGLEVVQSPIHGSNIQQGSSSGSWNSNQSG